MTSNSNNDMTALAMLVTARQVAEILAISERSVWRLSSTGRLPEPVRVGGATRWRLSEVKEFIEGLSRADTEPHR